MNKPRSAGIVVGYVLGTLLSGAALAASNTSDNWDDGLAHGWTGNTAWTEATPKISGGNPGGYLSSTSKADGNPSRTIGAKNLESRYTEDYGAAGVYRISADIKLFSGKSIWVKLRFRYHDSRYNGWTYQLDGSIPPGEWHRYAVSFDPTWTDAEATAAGWEQESSTPSFAETMADVYSAEVRLLTTDVPGTTMGIDNFYLYARTGTVPVNPVPAPALGLPALAALMLGLAFFGVRRLYLKN